VASLLASFNNTFLVIVGVVIALATIPISLSITIRR
jgi:hypothetical protein